MRLRTLAGAYAGQIRDYSTAVGLAALRTGTAERLEDIERAPRRPVPAAAPAAGVRPKVNARQRRAGA